MHNWWSRIEGIEGNNYYLLQCLIGSVSSFTGNFSVIFSTKRQEIAKKAHRSLEKLQSTPGALRVILSPTIYESWVKSNSAAILNLLSSPFPLLSPPVTRCI